MRNTQVLFLVMLVVCLFSVCPVFAQEKKPEMSPRMKLMLDSRIVHVPDAKPLTLEKVIRLKLNDHDLNISRIASSDSGIVLLDQTRRELIRIDQAGEIESFQPGIGDSLYFISTLAGWNGRIACVEIAGEHLYELDSSMEILKTFEVVRPSNAFSMGEHSYYYLPACEPGDVIYLDVLNRSDESRRRIELSGVISEQNLVNTDFLPPVIFDDGLYLLCEHLPAMVCFGLDGGYLGTIWIDDSRLKHRGELNMKGLINDRGKIEQGYPMFTSACRDGDGILITLQLTELGIGLIRVDRQGRITDEYFYIDDGIRQENMSHWYRSVALDSSTICCINELGETKLYYLTRIIHQF